MTGEDALIGLILIAVFVIANATGNAVASAVRVLGGRGRS